MSNKNNNKLKAQLYDIIKLFFGDKNRYSNNTATGTATPKKTADTSYYGVVRAVNSDGSYNVQLDGSDDTVKCDKLVGANVGDTVLTIIQQSGHPVVAATIGGDRDALDAQDDIDNLNQYFWYKDGTGSESGAHVTEIPQDEFEATPAGGNVLFKSIGMYIRNGLDVVASYLADGVRLFKNGTIGDNTTSLFASFLTSGLSVFNGTGTEIAHLGYGQGNTQSGTGTADTPYYVLGQLFPTDNISQYDASRTYDISSLVKYNDKVYIYINSTPSSGHLPTDTDYWEYYIGNWSMTEGYRSLAAGFASHAEGLSGALGSASHSEGYSTRAGREHSHAEGYYTRADGKQSHAEGSFSYARGYAAHAEGHNCEANGDESHVTGEWNVSNYDDQLVCGKYNNNKANDIFEVGWGTGTLAADRKNAFAVDQDGHLKCMERNPFTTFTASGSASIGATSTGVVSCTGTLPTGYKPIAVQRINVTSNQGNVILVEWNLNTTTGEVSIRYRNPTSSAKTVDVSAVVLCTSMQ